MKSVLISIKPEWCEKIVAGKKIVEVRKSRPKLETPFKVYIYCTRNGKNIVYGATDKYGTKYMSIKNGKVIGEFVCDRIEEWKEAEKPPVSLSEICMTYSEIRKYGMYNEVLYLWHISELIIYDRPKELYNFVSFCPEYEKQSFTAKCHSCVWFVENREDMCYECACEGEKLMRRPPQSWCYVDE